MYFALFHFYQTAVTFRSLTASKPSVIRLAEENEGRN
jgi:hypothetical protein